LSVGVSRLDVNEAPGNVNFDARKSVNGADCLGDGASAMPARHVGNSESSHAHLLM